MGDYYSYKPLVTLPRPLVIVGGPGARVGKTCRAMNLLTAMPFAWVERRMAHALGGDAQGLELQEGPAAFAAAAREVMREVFGRSSSHLVAAPHHAVVDSGLFQWVRERADVVVLRIDPQAALGRVRADVQAKGHKHLALRKGLPFEDGAVLASLQDIDLVLARVGDAVDVGDEPPLAVAERILKARGLHPSGEG